MNEERKSEIAEPEDITALTDNTLFIKLKQDMQEILTLTRKVRLAGGPLATREIAAQTSDKIDSVRSELYLLQQAIDEVREQALRDLIY